MDRQRGSQSLLALGIEWSSKITVIGLEFSIPALVGFGVDHWLRSTPAATVAGALVGFGLGMAQTMRIVRDLPGGTSRRGEASGDSTGTHRSQRRNDGSNQRPMN